MALRSQEWFGQPDKDKGADLDVLVGSSGSHVPRAVALMQRRATADLEDAS